MDPRKPKNNKKHYFAPSKKQPLVKKMIFDAHEAHVPSSCFELRPIHENESNQHDIIFDPRSSSLKEISEFDKNSPHELDKMMYGHIEQPIQNESLFINCDREGNSPQYSSKSQQGNSSFSENYNPHKRENPISYEETKKYESISKVFQMAEQQYPIHSNESKTIEAQKIENKIEYIQRPSLTRQQLQENQICSGKRTKLKRPQLKKIQVHAPVPKQIFEDDEPKLQASDENESSPYRPSHEAIKFEVKVQEISSQIDVAQTQNIRKKVQNPEFELINQYMELASYAALIDEMILVYDRSPLFEYSLDFDSETQESEMQEEKYSTKKQNLSKDQNQMKPENQVKIEQDQIDYQRKLTQEAKILDKNEKDMYTQLQRLKIQEAPNIKEKQRIIKEINFNHTKTYINFYEPIQQLRPYMKKMTAQEKKLFLAFKKEIKEIKDIIEYFEKKNHGHKKQHICKICGEQFETGRQLGGHMSRKHPGKAIEYGFKKELHKVKEIERNRRKYFKGLEDEVKIEQTDR